MVQPVRLNNQIFLQKSYIALRRYVYSKGRSVVSVMRLRAAVGFPLSEAAHYTKTL